MIIVAIASMFAVATVDTAASAQRSALSKCLKESVAKAKSAKVEVGAFDAYMRSQCAAQEADLRKAVIAIDVKNGISRKDAAENADMDVGDYFVSTGERYEAEVGRLQPKQAQAEAEPVQLPQPQQ